MCGYTISVKAVIMLGLQSNSFCKLFSEKIQKLNSNIFDR